MPTFLSPEWVDAFNEAVAGVAVPPPGDDAALAARDGSFTVSQVVRGGPQGEVGTTLVVEGGTVSMLAGASDDASVTMALAWDDAVAMASGSQSPAQALAAGRIHVRGDLGVLVAGQAVLAALHPHLQALNAATTY